MSAGVEKAAAWDSESKFLIVSCRCYKAFFCHYIFNKRSWIKEGLQFLVYPKKGQKLDF